MAKLEASASAIDRAVKTKRVGQIVLSQSLLEGLLGIDGGNIAAVQQLDHERQAGIFRIFVVSDRLDAVPDDAIAPTVELGKVQ